MALTPRTLFAVPIGRPRIGPPPAPATPKKFYSPTTKGFYASEIHGVRMPQDAVEITQAEWEALLTAQNGGKQIVPGPDGKPISTDPVPSATPSRGHLLFRIRNLEFSSIRALRNLALNKPNANVELKAIDDEIATLEAQVKAMPDPGATPASPGVTS